MCMILCVVPCSTQGDIRLQGGTNTSGRVEICNNGAWGMVCTNSYYGYTSSNARVACFQLGLQSSSKFVHYYTVAIICKTDSVIIMIHTCLNACIISTPS